MKLSWKRSRKWLGLLAISLVVVIVAGCQALNGVDFNAMLKQSLATSSYEGNETVELKLLLNDDADETMSAEEKEVIGLISNVSLELTDVKSSSEKGMSAKGSLNLGEKRIPFEAKMSNEAVELDLDGAKAPIVLHMPKTAPEAGAAAAPDQSTLAQAGKLITDAVAGYAVDNMPNPTHLSVLPGQESVNGDTVIGMNVHAELKGKELLEWVKSYVDALLGDREGLKAMLTGLLEALKSQSAAIGAVPDDSLFGSLPEEDDSAAGIDKATDEVVDMLTQLKDQIAQSEKDDAETLNSVLNDGTYVKGDLFVDSKLDIRKAVIEAAVNLAELKPAPVATDDAEEDFGFEDSIMTVSPFKGISVKITTDRWNVNGDVQPLQPTTDTTALDAEQLAKMQGYEVLRQFDGDSVVYDLLRNQAHIAKQTIALNTEYSQYAPIVTPGGITLIPLRFAAESFGATLSNAGGQLLVRDGATNTDIGLKIGSSNAIINGKAVKWSFPTTVVNGVTYVPARDFAKTLGAQLGWEQAYGSRTLTLVREP